MGLEETAMTRSEKPALLATVFTDYICPFCYIGDARLEHLREDYDLRINWCFLEIHPETPVEGMQVAGLGYPDSRWQQMMKNLAILAAEEGLEFRSHDFTTNSHKALLLAEAAKQDGAEVFYKLHRRLFAAFFTDGQNIGDREVLLSIARDSGVREATLASAWEDPRHEQRLDQYLAAARELNVRATPTVFFGERQRLDGALPLSAFKNAAQAGARLQREQAAG
jgi:predicted DsbA family dithiol-disulfide isomerase